MLIQAIIHLKLFIIFIYYILYHHYDNCLYCIVVAYFNEINVN